MKRIAYGEAYFPGLIRDNSFYVDKTPFLAQLEQESKNVIFLRPRRFGKSLWVSLLQHYYGIQYKDQYQALFGQLQVGTHPTPKANTYCILYFEFSRIDTSSPELTRKGFLSNVKSGVTGLLAAYPDFFDAKQREEILDNSQPNELMKALFDAWHNNAIPHQIYLLIDEYDHFTNELVTFRLEEFKDAVGKNGYVRKFYETLKTASGAGIVERMFITGVSPITLDSITSGFNIGAHYTTKEALHDMMGFTEADCMDVLRNIEVPEAEFSAMMNDLRYWYDGYKFAVDAPNRLYNSDMVLYFAQEYKSRGAYPRDMLDPNIAPDYGKIRNIFRIAHREQINRVTLDEVLTDGATMTELTVQFSFEKAFTADDFRSMLFYMGYLTIREAYLSKLVLQIPNEVIRRLYWNYFSTLISEDTNMQVSLEDVNTAIDAFALKNNPYPLLTQVERTLEALSNRDDMHLDEKHVKAIFVSFLALSKIWFIKSEFETARKYIDLLLLRRRPYHIPYQFAIEFKYLHKSDAKTLAAVTKEARAQLDGYLQQPEIAALDSRKAWLFIFVGTKQKIAEER